MKKLLLLFLFCTSIGAFAQESFTLEGKVSGNSDQAVEGDALLLDTGTGAIVKMELVSESAFSFGKMPKGTYTLQISCLGYETLVHPVTLDADKDIQLTLTESTLLLDEVAISATAKTFTNKNGNIKVDIANSPLRAIPNPLDLLAKLPTVLVAPDKESLSIVGRGEPFIYIDKQKVTLNDFNALSVEDIKSIEILTNPSSKYEANGRAVVLVTRKFSKKDGFEAGISETASFKKGFNNYLGTNAAFKKDKTEFRANFNYNQLNPWEGHANALVIGDAGFATDYDITSESRRPQFVFGGGVFHNLNDDDYLSFSMNGKLQSDTDTNITHTNVLQNGAEDIILTKNNVEEQRNFLNTFVNYNKNLKGLGATMFTGFQYSTFLQDSDSRIQNAYNGAPLEAAQARDQRFAVNVYSGRADFEKTFANEMKLEIGGLYLSADANTNFTIDEYATGAVTNSEYEFTEKNTAAYSQLSGKTGKLTYSAGLRAEITDIEGQYANSDAPEIDKYYTSLFPKAELGFAIDSTMSVTLNYAKSIARPNYSSTSQVSVYNSPLMIFSRNLNLDPAITDEVSAGFQVGDKSVSLSYYKTSDPSYFAFSYDPVQNLISFNTKNYDRESGINLQAVVPMSYKSWNSANILSLIVNKIQDDVAFDYKANPYLYYYSSQSLKIAKDTTFTVNCWGLTKRDEGAFKRNPVFIMDLALSHTFYDSIDCTLSCNDVFKNATYEEDLTVNSIASRGRYFTDTKEVSLAIRYRLGSFKNSKYRQRDVDENAGRIR